MIAAKPAPPAPTTVKVPGTRGDTQANATSALTSAGFKVTVQTKDTKRPDQDGIVLAENPHAGASAAKGATVSIIVGTYTPATTTTTSTTTTGSHTSSTSSTTSSSTT